MQRYGHGVTLLPTCMSCHPCAGPHRPRLTAQRGRSSLAAPTPAIVSSSGPEAVWGQLPHPRHPQHLRRGWSSPSWPGRAPPAGLPGSRGGARRQSWELRWERFVQRWLWSPGNPRGKLSPAQDLQREQGGRQVLHPRWHPTSSPHRRGLYTSTLKLNASRRAKRVAQNLPSCGDWE